MLAATSLCNGSAITCFYKKLFFQQYLKLTVFLAKKTDFAVGVHVGTQFASKNGVPNEIDCKCVFKTASHIGRTP